MFDIFDIEKIFPAPLDTPALPNQVYTSQEKLEMKEFLSGRHSEAEWEAFFKFWELSRFMRFVSRVAGVLMSVLPFRGA